MKILGWVHDADARQLRFEAELSLTPAHPAFVPPPPTLYTCYRYGSLVFDGVRDVTGYQPPAAVRPSAEPDGTPDYGNFDQVEVAVGGAVTLAGAFGVWRFQSSARRVLVGHVVDAP
jgi:hypothetical protein